MRETLKKWWPWIKAVLLLLLLGGVGWQFLRIVQNEELQKTDRTRSAAEILWDQTCAARPGDLILCAALYLGGLCFCCLFWMGLLKALEERISLLGGVRAYFISQLGKYAPGKGVALLLRTTFAAEAGIRPGIAALTATYETLTMMAAGSLVAAILFSTHTAEGPAKLWHVLGLLVLAVVPILPGVFNVLVQRVARRFLKGETAFLPRLRHRTLFAGLALLACCWFFLGASLEAILHSLTPERESWTVQSWLQSTSFIAISYVAGFIASTPGGLGVREFLLQGFLAPQLGARAVVVVLLLRLLWTLAEALIASLVYWLPPHAGAPAIQEPLPPT